MVAAVEIVPMRRRHLRGVLRIERQVYPRPWTQALFVSELALRSTRAYLVARAGREVVGYAGLMMTLTDAHVTTVAVDPALQRSGIGTRLLLELLGEARVRGATAATLEVRLSNVGARTLYERFGFAGVGVRTGYYAEGEDALVMWTDRIDTPEYAARLEGIAARLTAARP